MNHPIPSEIGPYTIDREIGRGGMGIVYLGHDTRLDRAVAIKALPSHLATDPDRLARFEREARTLASLSHPNVAGIYGVEEQGGQKYLILEYVEGETLEDRLDRGALPVDQAIEIAIEIASGVEAAHEAGVIHRDLKPANIKLTPNGGIKVLDFGLARTEDGGSSSALGLDTQSPTLTTPAKHSPTIAGTILGTAAYMSPEQARGRRVDKRSDIWSFGVVLYEMLAGSSPFRGETATDTLGAVLHKSFTIDGVPDTTPRMVRHVLHRCLERDKAHRFQSIGDVRIELVDALKRMEAGEPDEFGPSRSCRRSWVWPVLAACLAMTTTAGFGLWFTRSPAPRTEAPTAAAPSAIPGSPTVRTIEQITDTQEPMRSASISPDGQTVAYSAEVGDTGAQIHTLRIGGSTPFIVNRTANVYKSKLAFSPDGESIAYFSYGDTPSTRGMFIMGATGESPRRIVENDAFDPAWSPDGKALAYTTSFWSNPYSRNGLGQLSIVDIATRDRQKIDTSDPGDTSSLAGDAVSPAWSPDGSRIAYWGVRGGTRDIFTVSPSGGDPIRITNDVHTDWNPVWSPDGRAIWFLSDRGGQSGIWSIALTEDGAPIGDPRPMVLGPGGISQFSRSADGLALVAMVETARDRIERTRFDPETERFVGSPEVLIESTTDINSPDISGDGEWIAFQSGAPNEDITVMRLDGTDRRRLTQGIAKDRGPRWAPDGRRLYYYSNQSGDFQLWTVDRTSAESRPLVFEGVKSATVPEISPDGSRVAISGANLGSSQIGTLTDNESVTDIRAMPDGFHGGRWSPDSRWIAGLRDSPKELPDCAVLDTQTNEIVTVRTPTGEIAKWSTNLAWIDATRVLLRTSDQMFVFDVASGESREIENAPEDPGVLLAFRGDGWLYIRRTDETSNLWLVTLDAPPKE